jgi:hypothetical protein
VNQRNTAVRAMIQQLQNAFNETLDALYDLPEEYLQESCGHACARRSPTNTSRPLQRRWSVWTRGNQRG